MRPRGFGEERDLGRRGRVDGHARSPRRHVSQGDRRRIDRRRGAVCPAAASLQFGVVPGLVPLPFKFPLFRSERRPGRACCDGS
jgi:hypothetical protein